MAQPSTPSASNSIFGSNHHITGSHNNQPTESHATPASAASSNNTFLMPNSPVKGRRNNGDVYRPKITRTLGQRPACLVNASVTYCGDNAIYAFGGFDQYSDEGKSFRFNMKSRDLNSSLVYNHVLKLDMISHQWSLVDNYGDIPGVRMGKWEKENRHVIFDISANSFYRSHSYVVPSKHT